MQICRAEGVGAKLLLSLATNNDQNCGDKFSKFSETISQKFERLSRIQVNGYFRRQGENFLLPTVLFAAVALRKAQRAFEEPEFNQKEFLEDIRFRAKEIMAKGTITAEKAAERFFECVACCLADTAYFRDLAEKHHKYAYELINACCDKKTKEFQTVEHYKAEEMAKISAIFKEKVFLINYDESKDALENIPIDYKSVYVLKAKSMFFLLFKLEEITLTASSKVSHQDLALIFNIGYKLENDNELKSQISPEKSPQVRSKNEPSRVQPNIRQSKISQSAQKEGQSGQKEGNKFSVIKLKNSTLFPEQVKCKNCCRVVSEFNALYWNYASYCLQCVVSPRVDVTFVPANLIKKFLKNMHYDNNTPYFVVCPECQAEGSIRNYRVDDKPKEYECLTCKKTICIEHQRLIVECFCYCIQCRKTTITIESLFQKYCPACKKRLCELCNKKGTTECECMCGVCGEPQLSNHSCKGRCHNCRAADVWLFQCPCKLKLCSLCFYKRFEPNEQLCLATAK